MAVSHRIRYGPVYHNCLMLSPDGVPMCRLSADNASWYLAKNLAVKKETDPLVIQLIFRPKGLGHSGDDYYLSVKQNKCVVCGSDKELTRHHVIPKCYRKYFPEEMKSHSSYDVLPLCCKCHSKYEKHASALKSKISQEYNVPLLGNKILDNTLLDIKKCGQAIFKNGHLIPEDKLSLLRQRLTNYYGTKELSHGHILLAANIDPYSTQEDMVYKPYGHQIVNSLSDITSFVLRWRHHFVECMKPKFLSPFWSPSKTIL